MLSIIIPYLHTKEKIGYPNPKKYLTFGFVKYFLGLGHAFSQIFYFHFWFLSVLLKKITIVLYVFQFSK